MKRRAARRAGAGLWLTLLVASAAWAATAWQTIVASSTLGFTGTLDGGEFEGRFRDFDAGIVFDPADLAGSRFRVVVRTASADTAETDRDAALKGPDFFDVARYPTATYEADRFVATGPGRFEARGRLTIRDVTREVPVTFAFDPAPDGRTASLTGEATIRRLDFGVGRGDWRDTKWLADAVRIRFVIRCHSPVFRPPG